MFAVCMVLALWGPLPGPPWGPHIHLNNFESPIRMIPAKIPTMHFQKEDETVTFYKGPTGAHWGHPGNCHEQLLFSSNKVSTHYITWLFSFWIWRRRCLKFAGFGPLGPSPWAPMGATHTIWTTLNPLMIHASLVKIQPCVFKKMKM